MNTYYIAATITTAVAIFLGYLGSTRDGKQGSIQSAQETDKILDKLDAVQAEINNLKTDPTPASSSEIMRLENEYKNIADDFLKKLPIETAKSIASDQQNIARQLESSDSLLADVDAICVKLDSISSAFTRDGNEFRFERLKRPQNILNGRHGHCFIKDINTGNALFLNTNGKGKTISYELIVATEVSGEPRDALDQIILSADGSQRANFVYVQMQGNLLTLSMPSIIGDEVFKANAKIVHNDSESIVTVNDVRPKVIELITLEYIKRSLILHAINSKPKSP